METPKYHYQCEKLKKIGTFGETHVAWGKDILGVPIRHRGLSSADAIKRLVVEAKCRQVRYMRKLGIGG